MRFNLDLLKLCHIMGTNISLGMPKEFFNPNQISIDEWNASKLQSKEKSEPTAEQGSTEQSAEQSSLIAFRSASRNEREQQKVENKDVATDKNKDAAIDKNKNTAIDKIIDIISNLRQGLYGSGSAKLGTNKKYGLALQAAANNLKVATEPTFYHQLTPEDFDKIKKLTNAYKNASFNQRIKLGKEIREFVGAHKYTNE